MGLTLLGSQLVAAAVLWVTTFLVGTLPSLVGSRAKQRHHRGQKPGTANGQFESNGNGPKGAQAAHDDAPRSLAFAKVLSFLMNFGGGVLFATCFIHMLPEVRESFSSGGNKQQPSAHDDSSTTVIEHLAAHQIPANLSYALWPKKVDFFLSSSERPSI